MSSITMRVMNRRGDRVLTADRENVDEMKTFQAEYERLRAGGYISFAISNSNMPADRVTEIPEYASEIIMVPQLVGG